MCEERLHALRRHLGHRRSPPQVTLYEPHAAGRLVCCDTFTVRAQDPPGPWFSRISRLEISPDVVLSTSDEYLGPRKEALRPGNLAQFQHVEYAEIAISACSLLYGSTSRQTSRKGNAAIIPDKPSTYATWHRRQFGLPSQNVS